MPTKYKYDELDEANHEIRLAHVMPGAWEEPISCQLHLVSLRADKPPTYQTLSYAWGDPNVTKSILLDGCSFPVAVNLYTALQRLRRRRDVRVVWIDALCINQLDTIERNRQVMMMRDIYSQCTEVLMWLGESSRSGQDGQDDKQSIEEGTAQLQHYLKAKFLDHKPVLPDPNTRNVLLAFELLHVLSIDEHLDKKPCFVKQLNSSWSISTAFQEGFKELLGMLNQPYWNRLWVVQEILLPPKAHIVYGSISAPWSMLISAGTTVQKHSLGCCVKISVNMHDDMYVFSKAFMGRVDSTRETALFLKDKKLSLLWTVRKYLLRQASDERDKIYGFLGLFTRENCNLESNYSITSKELYEQFTMRLISSTDDLEILVGDTVHTGDLPSWVANWSQTTSLTNWAWEQSRLSMYHYYAASGGSKAGAKLLPQSKLQVTGYPVDAVVAISRKVDSDHKLRHDGLMSCEEIMKAGGIQGDETQTYVAGSTWGDAYWRTICGDRFGQKLGSGMVQEQARRTTPEDEATFILWRATRDPDYQTGQNPLDTLNVFNFADSVDRVTVDRKLFVTRRGYLGVGSSRIQEGDEIYVINGSNMPFITRRLYGETNQVDSEHRSLPMANAEFLLIGECYVHGIMDGEASVGRSGTSLVLV